MKSTTPLPSHNWRRLGLIMLIVLSAYIVLPQLSVFKHSLDVLAGANGWMVGLATAVFAFTFLWAALTYYFLALKPIKYHRTALVALANMFTSRLLPAGSGGIATFYLYFRHNRYSLSEAGVIVGVNNFIGMVAHVSLLVALYTFNPNSFSRLFAAPINNSIIIGVCIALALAALTIYFIESWRRWINKFLQSLAHDLKFYKHHPLRLLGAYGSSLLLTITYVFTLWLCLASVGVTLNPLAILMIFTIGVLVGALTPTPGGLGGTEAGLLAGLVGYHVSPNSALAAVLIFRLITYWLSFAVGALTFVFLQRRQGYFVN